MRVVRGGRRTGEGRSRRETSRGGWGEVEKDRGGWGVVGVGGSRQEGRGRVGLGGTWTGGRTETEMGVDPVKGPMGWRVRPSRLSRAKGRCESR